jgi:hypothetical protein
MFHPLTSKYGFFTNGASGGKPGTPARSPMVRRIRFQHRVTSLSIRLPAGAHDMGYALGIVPFILVQLHAQSRFHMPGINTDHIEGTGAKLMHQPRRHRPRLQTDHGFFRALTLYRSCDRVRRGSALASPEPSALLIDNADRRRSLLGNDAMVSCCGFCDG